MYVAALQDVIQDIQRRETAASWFHKITGPASHGSSLTKLKEAATELRIAFEKVKPDRLKLERAILENPQVYAP